jgi:hypothetical protein
MSQIILASPGRKTRGVFHTREDAREFQNERPDWTEDVPRCKKCGLELVVTDGRPHSCPHY